MPRVFTPQTNAELLEEPTGLQWVWVAAIVPPTIGGVTPATLYIADNFEDFYVLANRCVGIGFQWTPPEDRQDGMPTGQIIIPNVNQWLTPLIRNAPPAYPDPPSGQAGVDPTGWFYATIYKMSAGDSGDTYSPARDSNIPKFDYIEEIVGPYQLRAVQYDAEKVQAVLTREYIDANPLQADTFDPFNFPALS
jgi:hypothetical protein